MHKERTEFFKRWNVKVLIDPREEYQKFLIRISNTIQNHQTIFNQIRYDFCKIIGTHYFPDRCVIRQYIFNLNNNEPEFYFSLQVILNLLSGASLISGSYSVEAEASLHNLIEAIELSDINLTFSSLKNHKYILYPKGEKLLDEKLVDQVLNFLDQKGNKHFIQALEFYSKNSAIKSSESLRRCLEEFLRFKLGNAKGLKQNIEELQTKLKSQKTDPQVRNIIFSTFGYLDQYFNENSKHKDGSISEAENEFLLYQIGLLTRYIDKSIKAS